MNGHIFVTNVLGERYCENCIRKEHDLREYYDPSTPLRYKPCATYLNIDDVGERNESR